MSKLKNAILFIIILFMIFLFYFCMYKNIDKLIPKYENELYTFSNNTEETKTDFLVLFEMFEELENSISYKRISSDEEINAIKENKILYNFIKNYIYREELSEEIFNDLVYSLYMGELTNTIYGDLKCISNRYNIIRTNNKRIASTGFSISYSEDMKKIYFLNRDIEITNRNLSVSYYDESAAEGYEEKYEYGEQFKEMESIQSRKQLVQSVKEVFSKAILNVEFNPDIIMYREYYILKDTNQDIMVLYNKDSNTIFGLLIGFGM